jgi:REP element-mobilizing transposase RayT
MRTYDLGHVEITKRNRLPHWNATHAVQYVTFNLADAIPKDVQSSIEAQCNAREAFIRATRGALTLAEQHAIAKERRRAIERALDQDLGECLLRDEALAAIVAQSIQFLDGWKYELVAWTVMPNHGHLLYRTMTDSPGSIMHSLKGFTGREINRGLGRQGRVWAEEYYDHAVRNSEELQRIVRYIMNNPSRAGLRDWKFMGMKAQVIQELL